jgi:hypothetical protein
MSGIQRSPQQHQRTCRQEILPNVESRVPLGRCLCTHHHERACGRASWTGDRSLVDEGDSPSARTAVCDDQNLVLVTLASARCSLAVGAHDPQRAFTGCGCCARRSGRTLCTLRPWRSLWARRTRRTGFAFFSGWPGRAGLPLWPLSAARYANGKCNCNHDTLSQACSTPQPPVLFPTRVFVLPKRQKKAPSVPGLSGVDHERNLGIKVP